MVQCAEFTRRIDSGPGLVPVDGCRHGCPLGGLDPTPLATSLAQWQSPTWLEFPTGSHVDLARYDGRWLLTLHLGLLKVGCANDDGRVAVAGLRYPGDPIDAYGGCGPSALFLEAVIPTTICAIDRRVLDASPHLAARVLARRLAQTQALLVAAERRQIELVARPPDARLAWFLLELAARPEHRVGAGGAEIVRPILRRREIGECLGLAAETVSRALTRLLRAGFVRKLSGGRLQIVDRAALAALVADRADAA